MNRKNPRDETTGSHRITRSAKKQRVQSPSPALHEAPVPTVSTPALLADTEAGLGVKGTPAPTSASPVDVTSTPAVAAVDTQAPTTTIPGVVPSAVGTGQQVSSATAISGPSVITAAVVAPPESVASTAVRVETVPETTATSGVSDVVPGLSTAASFLTEKPGDAPAAQAMAVSNSEVEVQPALEVGLSRLSGAPQPTGNTVQPRATSLLPAAVLPDPMPRPEVTFSDVDYVPIGILNRMRNIVRYREVTSNRFSLPMVPRAADWGRNPRTEKLLCVGGKPILIWMVGRVRSLWFFDRNGDPHLRVNLGFTLHSSDEQAAISEMFGRSRPHTDSVPTTIYAGRICSRREKGEYCDTPTAFTHVYDATSRLTAKSAMPRLSPVDLGKNDVVVVECNFTRWRPPTEGKSKKTWSSFDVGFDLMSIFLLHSAPADVPDGDGVDAVAEITAEL